MDRIKKAKEVYDILTENYPNIKIALNFSNSYELCLALILAAQCKDETVNKITKELFKYDIVELANCSINRIKKEVYSSGFYNRKAEMIQKISGELLEKHNGIVPKTMRELTKLPGIGRKSANIILTECFGITEGIAVDTHVSRISQRLGLTNNTTPTNIERDLLLLFDKDMWSSINIKMVQFGRDVCDAKQPKCKECYLYHLCNKGERR